MNQFHNISPSLLCVYPICPPSRGSFQASMDFHSWVLLRILLLPSWRSNQKSAENPGNRRAWQCEKTWKNPWISPVGNSMLQTLQCLHSSPQVITELISRSGCFKLKTNKSRSSAPVFSSRVIHPSPPSMSSSLFSCSRAAGKIGSLSTIMIIIDHGSSRM